ncbi:uncharacterized protein LOC143855746 [Tasmannia lanceolata]|uniref:uncharacterized protein LOC143855746 n=1 Tax=Tasmannia lanceolata TaxID=3420 RepID=UPI0040644BF4
MLENGKLEVERPNVTRNPLPNHRAIPPPATNAIFVEEPVLDPSILICAITPDEPYILRFDPEEIEEMERERSYALWRGSTSLAEASSPYVLRCEDVEAEKETPYVLRMGDFEEEEVIETPYVLRMDADDLLLLEDQCDELRHVTRGGRVFKPAELRAENPAEAVRAAENQGQSRPSADEEEDNLLKQLKKTQANVSIWGLLMSSSKHRKVVLKELNAAQVSTEITPDELVSLVAVTRTSKVISFTDDDLPPEGSDHARSLKITVICNKKRVPEVLVDNGSALNICPLSTAATLGFGPGDFIPSEQGILAYDGTRRDVIGTLATEIQIGGEDFDIEFQVLDIKASFLLLLGRPWLHKVGVIPSTLHQKLKFVHNGRVVTVKGDPDLEIGQISQELVVGKEADVSLTGFSLEVSVISMKEAMGEEVFFLTSTNSNVVRMIRKQGYIPGAGLGKYHQGPTEWPVIRTFNGLFGLGYEPTEQEVKEMKRYMLKWAECRRRGLELPMGSISLVRNGIFRKEGADFPFCGFAEPWTDDVTGQRLPGFEIFFNLELSEAPMSVRITEEASETDWADVLEPSCLNVMFQIEYPVVGGETEASEVAVIGRDAFILNPAELITPAEGPLTNWTSQVLPRVVFQYSPVSSKESVVSKYTSTSQSDIEFVYSNDSFDAGTVEVGSGSGVGDKSLSNKVESKSTLDDEFISSTAHMPALVEFNVELSVESLNTSLKSNAMPAVGYSILDVTNSMNEMKDSFTYIPVSVSPVSISSTESALKTDNINNDNQDSFSDEDADETPLEIKHMIQQEESRRARPLEEEIETVNIGDETLIREIRIGKTLSPEEREELITLLKEFKEVFAWSYDDMPGLSEDIVQHRLPLIPGAKPKKQKLRKLKTEWELKVHDEVKKLLEVKFIQVVEYPEWLANIVPVPKKDGKVRMCVDFRDLNKASPKDDFPLPNIDLLVDNTAGHALLSFMDGFSGYNQIKMAPEDMIKTAFTTQWGTYCYRVMPFGLKNAGATYQRAATTLLHDMIHKEVEVYVDDMIVKGKTRPEHTVALRKFFERIRKYQLRLNPSKCVFGVTSGKLLGFMVSERGIEVDPQKIKAIQEMEPPRTEKQIRGFLGKVQYLRRFIAHLTMTCEPIFKLLKKNSSKKWTEECQVAFEKIKQCLSLPPVLSPVILGQPLLLYLSITDTAMGCMLAQQDSGSKKERPVYYISKKMLEYEVKYTILEKTCLALVWATQRLRHYLLSSKVLLLSRMDPLKYLFEKPALTGRTARWLLLLSEFDITYDTQKSVKGRVIAEQLADSPVEENAFLKVEFPDEEIMDVEEDTPNTRWTMYFDGAVNNQGQGIGAVLVSPQKEYIPISIKLQTKNHFADALATLASMLDISATMEVQPLTVRLQWEPAHVNVIEIAARCPDGKPWYTDIGNLISGEGHPPEASGKERRTLQKLAANFVICGDQLYRRSFDGIQLLCVDEDKAVELIEQTHEGVKARKGQV